MPSQNVSTVRASMSGNAFSGVEAGAVSMRRMALSAEGAVVARGRYPISPTSALPFTSN
jgi:hypothetical protein